LHSPLQSTAHSLKGENSSASSLNRASGRQSHSHSAWWARCQERWFFI